jgi:hypothetical protein
VREYTAHYHAERNHQGRGNELLEALREEPSMDGPVECQERLGGTGGEGAAREPGALIALRSCPAPGRRVLPR